MSSIKNEIHDYFTTLKNAIDYLNYNQIEKAVVALMSAYENGRTVFIFGNGGSASLASHMACDLGKNTLGRVYDENERRFRVVSLTDNIATITAYANDLSFDDIFIQQMRNLVEPEDVVFAISGSGKSPNIIKALEYAKSCGALTIGLLGFKNGGPAGQMVDIPIIVNSDHYGIIEGIHTEIEHFLTEILSKLKKEWDERNTIKSQEHKITRAQEQELPIDVELPSQDQTSSGLKKAAFFYIPLVFFGSGIGVIILKILGLI